MSFATKQETYFPTLEASYFNLQNIRRRLVRKTTAFLSVILEAAFIVILLTTISILQAISKQSGGVTLRPEAYQYWIVVVAILVLGAGVINPIVMFTAERIKELGIMKSLGATNTAIIKMLLIESALIGLLGGVVGAVTGWLITVAIYSLQVSFTVILTVPLRSHLFNFALAVTASLLLSIIAAIYPAYQAAKLRPADALRRET